MYGEASWWATSGNIGLPIPPLAIKGHGSGRQQQQVGVAASFSNETGEAARLILFYKIINGLAKVPFKSVIIEAYMDTRRNKI